MLGKAETPAQTPASFVLSHQALAEKVGCCSTSLSARSGVLVGKITITDTEEVVFLQKRVLLCLIRWIEVIKAMELSGKYKEKDNTETETRRHTGCIYTSTSVLRVLSPMVGLQPEGCTQAGRVTHLQLVLYTGTQSCNPSRLQQVLPSVCCISWEHRCTQRREGHSWSSCQEQGRILGQSPEENTRNDQKPSNCQLQREATGMKKKKKKKERIQRWTQTLWSWRSFPT